MNKFIIPLLFLVLTGCSSQPHVEVPEDIAVMENVAVYSGETEPLSQISFEKEAVFGDTEEILIGNMAGIDVDEEGNLFLADAGAAVIHKYDRNGKHLTTIGRQGEGPGEFTSLSVIRNHQGILHAMDGRQRRISQFDPDNGSYLSSFILGGNQQGMSGIPTTFEPLSNGLFFFLFTNINMGGGRFSRNSEAKVIDYDGETIYEKFIEFNSVDMLSIDRGGGALMFQTIPFSPQSILAIDGNENIVWGISDRLHLKVQNFSGEYLRSIYYDHSNPAIDRNSLLESYEDQTVREAIRNYGVPETKTAFRAILIDDENRIWLSLNTDKDDLVEWWVLSQEGEKLAVFERPVNHLIQTVKNGAVYIREESEDGLQQIVKYRFSI